MLELLQATAGAFLWVGVFGLVVGVVNRRGARPWSHPAGVPAAYVFFVVGQILALKALHLLGLVSTPWVVMVFLIAAAGAGFRMRSGGNEGSGLSGESDPAPRRVALVTAGVLLSALAGFALVTPTHIWDVQAYHMPMVANYVQNGSLDSWPAQDLRQVFRVNAGELQMAALALLGHSDAAVAFPNLLGLLVSLVATFLIARSLFGDHPVAWLATTLVLTAPQILFGAVTAKNDLVFMALVLCAFHWTLLVTSDPTSRSGVRLALAGAAAGAAVATKVMGLNVMGAIGLILLVLGVRKRIPVKAPFVFGGVGVAVVFLLVGDIYWANFRGASAVPVGTAPGEIYFTSGFTNVTAAARYYLYDLSFKRLVTAQVFEHDFSHYGYFFPFLLVFGTAAALGRARTKGLGVPGVRVLGALTFVLFLSVIAVRQPIYFDQRFMIWMVPCFALLASAHRARLDRVGLLVAVSFSAAFSLTNLFLIYTNGSEGLFARSSLHLASTGELARLTDVVPSRYTAKIDGFDVLDGRAQPSDSILYVGWEDTWMYPAWGRRFTRFVSGVSSLEDARTRVAGGAYRFVVVEDDAGVDLREGAVRASWDAGYSLLTDADGRTIFERPVDPSIPSRQP